MLYIYIYIYDIQLYIHIYSQIDLSWKLKNLKDLDVGNVTTKMFHVAKSLCAIFQNFYSFRLRL